ncbi:hypothetical protein [Oceanobacillus salinisoli]|uniref:hypothetical protein n=1 Tax=Oceanobacillus salinisoli TaxID=2678611 RepID=UPI0012E19AAE|nr:hypothetical protein [Oceanobacillus salinisoli]
MLKKTTGFFDGMMNHSEAKSFVREHGEDGFLEYLQDQYPSYDLGGFSTAWEFDKKYICKARGRNGDIIIGWEENNYS